MIPRHAIDYEPAMLGYIFKDTFSFLAKSPACKRLCDSTLMSARDLFRQKRRFNPHPGGLMQSTRPALNQVPLSHPNKPLENPAPAYSFWSALIFHPDSSRPWLKTKSRFAGDQCHLLPLFHLGESSSMSCQDISYPSKFSSQLSTASHPTPEHSKMIFSLQEPEESLRNEIRSMSSEFSQPSEEALAALLICSQRLMFFCVSVLKKVSGSLLGRTIHRGAKVSVFVALT